jgi:hypothetical protein
MFRNTRRYTQGDGEDAGGKKEQYSMKRYAVLLLLVFSVGVPPLMRHEQPLRDQR